MIQELLAQYLGTSSPNGFFGFLVFAGIVAVAGAIWLFRASPEPESQFKLREADRIRARKGSLGRGLGDARMRSFEAVLRLEGIRIDGQPHEILGVSPHATPEQVQKAYRELMKRFHPDKIGPPGSREWKDAQRIAEAINGAKEALLKKGQ